VSASVIHRRLLDSRFTENAGYIDGMGGDIHKHAGREGPGRSEGDPAHLKQEPTETYWESEARKTLIEGPVRTWQGAAHKAEASSLAEKAKDLAMAIGSSSIKIIDKELSALKKKIHDLENKIRGMREDE
jgi:hypothetical protein